jgi:hypothetical protein
MKTHSLFTKSLERIPLILVNIPFMIKFYLFYWFCQEFRKQLSSFLRIRFYVDINTCKKRACLQRKLNQLEEQLQYLKNCDDNKTINFSLDEENANTILVNDNNNLDKIKCIKAKNFRDTSQNETIENKFIFKCFSEYNSND